MFKCGVGILVIFVCPILWKYPSFDLSLRTFTKLTNMFELRNTNIHDKLFCKVPYRSDWIRKERNRGWQVTPIKELARRPCSTGATRMRCSRPKVLRHHFCALAARCANLLGASSARQRQSLRFSECWV